MSIKQGIEAFNSQHSDTTIYFQDIDFTFIKTQAPLADNAFRSIQTSLRNTGFSLFEYQKGQWMLLEDGVMEQSFASIAESAELDQRANALKSRALQDIFVFEKSSLKNNKLSLTGTVQDAENQEPLIGASIVIKENGSGTTTDINGEFQMELVPGEYQFELSSIGYAPRKLNVIAKGNGHMELFMVNEAVLLNEVVISERGSGANVRSPIVGLQELSIKQIKKLPSLMGQVDVIKSLVVLAGVSSNPDGLGGVNIRGGNADQNLIIQNDIVYFNSAHALGFISAFNPDFVSKVDLYKGYIPPKYGGRLSSVISTETKAGNLNEWKGKLNLGMVNSGAFLEGPLLKNKTSVASGARVSHANWMLGLINLPESQKSELGFYDLQAKVEHRISLKSNLGVEWYKSHDDFLLLGDVLFDYNTQNAQAYYRQVIGRNTNLTARINITDYNSSLDDRKLKDATRFSSGIASKGAKLDIVTSLGKLGEINYGTEVQLYNLKPGSIDPANAESQIFPRSAKAEQTREISAFAEIQANLGQKLKVNAGLRSLSFASLAEKTVRLYGAGLRSSENVSGEISYNKGEANRTALTLEPRFSLNYLLSDHLSFKTGYTRNFQFINQISNSLAPTPIDFWKASDYYFEPQQSDNFFAGIYKDMLNGKLESSVEVYYSIIDQVQEYKDFADLLANDFLETEILFGEGRNYGAEFSLHKTGGKISGRLSYTYARAFRKMTDQGQDFINRGEWYPSLVDKPHSLNALVNFNISQRISFNFNFAYQKGRPITVPVNRYVDWNASNILYYGDRNAYRIPDYHRLDFSLSVFPSYKVNAKFRSNWNISVLNLYGRKNPYSVFFRQKTFESLKAYKYSILGAILPSVSYNLEF